MQSKFRTFVKFCAPCVMGGSHPMLGGGFQAVREKKGEEDGVLALLGDRKFIFQRYAYDV